MTPEEVTIPAVLALSLVHLVILWRARGGVLYVLVTIWWAVAITVAASLGGWMGNWWYLPALLLAPVFALMNFLYLGRAAWPAKRTGDDPPD